MLYIIVGLAFAAVTALALYFAWVRPLRREQALSQWAYRISHGHARVDQMADTWPRGKGS